ncbi:MAG: hypothetical protein HOP17_04135 [Acidobacteria bacterium]|nr:hypothetical protein [Acidobacteriota bacterium]
MERREIVLGGIIMLAALTALDSCRANSSTRTMSAKTLADKYSVSIEAARREFDGKELVIKGYASNFAVMPKDDESEGMILLNSGKKDAHEVQCWFSRYEAAEFAGFAAGRPLTVRGIFNGESGISLKFCKLVLED